MRCKINILTVSLLLLLISGCKEVAPKPVVEQKKQYVTQTVTANHYKINEFRRMMEKENIEPIYIFINFSSRSEVPTTDMPNIKKMTHSLLSDFGEKVHVVTSAAKINEYANNSSTAHRVYILDGAITTYDQGILSQSSSTNLSLRLGEDDKKVKNRDRFKNKTKESQLIGDMYLKQNHLIKHKTTSSIIIRETNKGYDFGLNLHGLSLGISSYKNLKDGLGLSVRKLVEGSLIDLVAKAIGVKSFQVMPEVQAEKLAKKPTHLSNYDFCSDMNRIVLYVHPLQDIKFKSFGMSFESEKNKLLCLKDLYDKAKDKKYIIKLKSMMRDNLDMTTAHRNAQFIRREISKIGIPRNMLIMENKYVDDGCDKTDDYCKFIKNRVEIEKIMVK
ncbi:MAG: hypothetical protein U9P71_02640 [Campylobacterota bacterium]|nr:hypothetical protein [Campylobacterota bacterium]